MNCPKCGFQINPDENYCPKCGSKNNQDDLLYKENTSISDSNNNSEEIETKQPKKTSSIVIVVLLVAVLLSAAVGSYYISFSKFSSDDLKQSQKTSAEKSKDNSNDQVVPQKKSDENSDIVDAKSKTDTKKTDPSSSYIFPKSKSEKLLESNVAPLSKENLALARNEIYARHGYVFKAEPFKSYFNSKSWYKPNPNFKGLDTEFNAVELYNRKLFSKYESN